MSSSFTAVSIKRDLYQAVKAEASRQGRTPTNFVTWAIRRALAEAGDAR